MYSKAGTEIHVSHDGAITIPPGERKKLLYRHLDEMDRLKSQWRRELDSPNSN